MTSKIGSFSGIEKIDKFFSLVDCPLQKIMDGFIHHNSIFQPTISKTEGNEE